MIICSACNSTSTKNMYWTYKWKMKSLFCIYFGCSRNVLWLPVWGKINKWTEMNSNNWMSTDALFTDSLSVNICCSHVTARYTLAKNQQWVVPELNARSNIEEADEWWMAFLAIYSERSKAKLVVYIWIVLSHNLNDTQA